MITFNNIVNRFEKFVSEHHFLRTFSHGSPSGVDLNKFEVYPTLHLVYTGANYDSTSKEYSFEVYILDLPPDKADKVDNQQQLISNAEQAAEDILADLRNGGNIFDFGHLYTLTSANTTPLEETTSNSLSGVLLTIAIEVGFEYDSCNAPLSGVTPSGSASESLIGRQSIVNVTGGIGTTNLTGAALTTLSLNSTNNWTSYNYNMNGSASFLSNLVLGRHEIHGLNSKTNVKLDITLSVTASAATTFTITTSNIGFNFGLSENVVFTSAGTKEVSYSVNANSELTDDLYTQFKIMHAISGSVEIKSFTYTITDPLSA
jgi:hypothetical protein